MDLGFSNLPGQRGDNGPCVLAAHFDQDGETQMPFHQGCDVTVLDAAEQVALPMTWDGAVLNLCGSFADGDGIGMQ